MAKVTGPLLSLGAQGAIGKSQVYASWRGVPYARRYVVPANPNTTAQQTTRSTFSAADDQFKRMLAIAQEPYQAAAKGRPYTPRNEFIKQYVKNLRGDADFTDYVASPGVNGGLPLVSLAAVGGAAAGEIDVDATIPSLPVDWTHDRVLLTWFPDRDPALLMQGFAEEMEILEAAWAAGPPRVASTTLSGLDTGVSYVVSALLQSTRADGKIAYGLSSTVITAAT